MRRLNKRFLADVIALEIAAMPVTIPPEDEERSRVLKRNASLNLELGLPYDEANEEDFDNE